MKKELTQEQIENKDKAKKELRVYRENVLYVKEKKEDIEEYKAMIESVTPKLSHSNTSHNNTVSDKIGSSVGRLDEIEKEMNKRLEQLLIQKFIIDEKIDKLKFPYRDILFMRYSRSQSWREIQCKMKYESDDYIYKLHGEALIQYGAL